MNYDAKDILESINTAVLLADIQMRIVYANTAAEQLLGMSASKLCTIKITELIEKHQKNVIDIFKTAVKPNFQGFVASDIMIVSEGGHAQKVDMSLCLYTQRPRGIIVEMRSLNYQQKLNDDRQRRTQHLAARDLVRNLAHEIKNPLGGIRGAAQLLEMTLGNSSNVRDYTKVIIEQADRLKNLVDMLLGPQRPNPMTLDNIHYVIEKVLSLESMTPDIKVRFEKNYDPSLPEIDLDVDAMQQALINIINNAIQALSESNTKNPTIKIKTRAKLGAVLNGIKFPTSIAIDITDNGPGIPENIQQTLFYPMVTSRQNGNGLGLSIAQSIVERHKGTIEVNSIKGETTFTIMLPILKKGTNIQ